MRQNASIETLKKRWRRSKERICDYCGDPFEASRWWQVYCSQHCRQAAYHIREIEKAAKKRKKR
ncbi:MAG: hypothetical protein GTO22_00400 [Gemmatimonadales bacterium]|nr:hypothetical protein [Gemmatimonadales bacterium]